MNEFDVPEVTPRVKARLTRWIEEATDETHPNHRHSMLDHPDRIYTRIVPLLRKLREDTERFSRDDVSELIGILNSGGRMKNVVAERNELPELRQQLLTLLYGDGPVSSRLEEARRRIHGAADAILGELYGWAHAEEAPLYNGCAKDALQHLGYAFDRNDYDAFVAAHNAFKEVYTAEVGRLRPDLPLNLEMDTLYNVIDKVDLQDDPGAINGAPSGPMSALFADRAEMDWMLDWMASALNVAGVENADDERYAVTLRQYPTAINLHLSSNVLLGLQSPGAGDARVRVLLLQDDAPFDDMLIEQRYRWPETESFVGYRVPVDAVRPLEKAISDHFHRSMDAYLRAATPLNRAHQRYQHHADLGRAIFDPALRDALWNGEPVSPETTRYWRVTLPTSWQAEVADGGAVDINVWQGCLQHGIAAVDFNGNLEYPLVQKFTSIAPGDIIVAFLQNKRIGGIGVVTQGFLRDLFENRPESENYFDGRLWIRLKVAWEPCDLSVDSLPQPVANKFLGPTIIELTPEDYQTIVATIGKPIEDEAEESTPEPYLAADFLEATYLTQATAAELQALVADRSQLVFYGPPGTGKTYVAKHLARLITGLAEPPPEQVGLVQFHPAYGYEDFIEGIRPASRQQPNGQHLVDYPVQDGVFKRFCLAAQRRPKKRFVFIIDEINRGNIPRIFGELMLLLEYRDEDVTLPYSGKRFRIPPNVVLIGTMNTADRSIALVDFALRRRFHFVNFRADPDLFERWVAANPVNVPYLSALYRALSTQAISDANFAIGPSHFMRPGMTEEQLALIWRRSITPYLEEYYFDQPAKARPWAWDGERVRGIRHGNG